MILVFIGAAGSGKDTQAEILAQKHGFQVISSGQIFRDAIAANTPEGLEAEKYTDAGELVPDDLVYKMLERYVQTHKSDNMIFTGTVRTSPQVEMMDETLAKLGTKLDYAVYFKLGDADAIRRISGRRYGPTGKMYHLEFKPPLKEGIDDETGEPLIQRDDDQPEAIAKRLAEFHKNNEDVLRKYKERGQLIEIDANQSIEAIASDVAKALML
jgi:adenylate kinase